MGSLVLISANYQYNQNVTYQGCDKAEGTVVCEYFHLLQKVSLQCIYFLQICKQDKCICISAVLRHLFRAKAHCALPQDWLCDIT